MNAPNMLWSARHCEAVCEALERALEQLGHDLAEGPPITQQVQELALTDARLLRDRVHRLRRRVEEAVAEAGAAAQTHRPAPPHAL